MHGGRAELVHLAVLRPRWRAAAVTAASDVAKHLLLTLTVIAAGAVAVALLLTLLVVATPIGGALLLWVLWRSSRGGRRTARRLRAHARRRARALGVRIAS
jgi:hypothetical protein